MGELQNDINFMTSKIKELEEKLKTVEETRDIDAQAYARRIKYLEAERDDAFRERDLYYKNTIKYNEKLHALEKIAREGIALVPCHCFKNHPLCLKCVALKKIDELMDKK